LPLAGKGGDVETGGSQSAQAGAGEEPVGGDAAAIGGSGGSGGTGGTTGCDCPAGKYCRDGSTDCFACKELNRLRFDTPERLGTLSDSGAVVDFPRRGMTATDLVYVVKGEGLHYTTDFSTSPGIDLNETQALDRAPLLLEHAVTGMTSSGTASFNFAFDRPMALEKRAIFVATWGAGAKGTPLPEPFNTGDDYSIAVAERVSAGGPARGFWMSARLGMPRLFTALLQADATAAEVSLRIGYAKCTTVDHDLAPWVTSDGKALVFSHARVDGSCQAVPAQKRDLYATLLQPESGQPPVDTTNATVPATPLSDVNSSADEIEPSFSADLCDLYFASDRDGQFAIYRAHRR